MLRSCTSIKCRIVIYSKMESYITKSVEKCLVVSCITCDEIMCISYKIGTCKYGGYRDYCKKLYESQNPEDYKQNLFCFSTCSSCNKTCIQRYGTENVAVMSVKNTLSHNSYYKALEFCNGQLDIAIAICNTAFLQSSEVSKIFIDGYRFESFTKGLNGSLYISQYNGSFF